jgi:TPP-dependent pyruvate/acetoin dehydrogenase alpha subunit
MMTYSKELLKHLYKTMVRIRVCEESLVEPLLKGEIRCPVHLYSGEEAIATGVCAALSERGYVFGTHRSHGHYLAMGGGMRELVAEIYGKETGCSRGRGGSMHIIDVDSGVIGSAPIVAGTISLAVGAALASKIRRDHRVSVAFFGDGATGEGVLHESLNFAALKKLPVIFVCENNLYSTHLPIRECRPANNIFQIGKAHCVKSKRTDGNNVLKVYETASEAVDICRAGNGPFFLECVTYRLRGHVGPDDNVQGTHTDIRPPEEVARWKRRDPIKVFRKFLLVKGLVEAHELLQIEDDTANEVEDAHAYAKNSLYPEREELERYVFK